jgi:hypothetical protein
VVADTRRVGRDGQDGVDRVAGDEEAAIDNIGADDDGVVFEM